MKCCLTAGSGPVRSYVEMRNLTTVLGQVTLDDKG